MSTPTIPNPLSKAGDVVRGSLIAAKLEDIPHLVKSVAAQVRAHGGKFYIKNFWDDPAPLSLGYVGVHIKIRLPIPPTTPHMPNGVGPATRHVLAEVQLHPKAIMNGTEGCAKEIAHRLYKAPEDGGKEVISPEIIKSSQLVYLTSMTKLLSTKADIERLENTLYLVEAATKVDKQKNLILETAMLLYGNNAANALGRGKWNESLSLAGCIQVSDEGLAHLEGSTKLRSLNLSSCMITDMGLGYLWRSTGIESLYCEGCEEITDMGLSRFWQQRQKPSNQNPNPERKPLSERGDDPWRDIETLHLYMEVVLKEVEELLQFEESKGMEKYRTEMVDADQLRKLVDEAHQIRKEFVYLNETRKEGEAQLDDMDQPTAYLVEKTQEMYKNRFGRM